MSVSLHSDYVAISEFKRVSMFLLLQVLALLWFCVTPGDASSDRLMGDDSLAGHIDKSDYWAQSEYSVTDEKPPGGGNPPREEKDAVEPITSVSSLLYIHLPAIGIVSHHRIETGNNARPFLFLPVRNRAAHRD